MNRAILISAAGMLTVAVAGMGCEQDKAESARVGSARGESMRASQSTGQPGTGAKHGTGTTAAGVTTGDTTTGAPVASPEATAPAKDAGTTGQTASNEGHGPGGIDQQKTTVAASADGATATASAAAPKSADAAGAGASAAGPDAVNAPSSAQPAAAEDNADKEEQADAWAQVKPSAAAPKEMQVTGTVKFAKADHGVKVMVDLKGLTPNGKHGFHIHEKGDLSDPKLMSVGPHFNPDGKEHGGAEGDERHGGDLGNLTADDKGHAKVTIMAHGISIDDEKTGIVGRSIIVHAKADDEKTDPSGNSGDRIAGGAIEKPSKAENPATAEKKSADAGSSAAPAVAEDQPPASVTPAAQQPQEELNK